MNGTAAWLLTTDTGAGLMDLLTGAWTQLPANDDENSPQLDNPRGIISGDGTILLYNSKRESARRLAFMATFLRPGDVTWTQVKTTLDYSPDTGIYFSATAAYHNGKILFRGQLLWVSVMVKRREDERTHVFSLVVHASEEEEDEMRWVVVRDGASLGGQVLFLGSCASFTMDAARLGVDGGCAYFIFAHDVLRYNFVNGEVTLVENLPLAWPAIKDGDWLLPQPTIASIQEIRNRLGLQQEH
ncbi:hypothetical protein ZWY2020_000375 [Hordeum vulgare]|nr:hypothetical protein ZWY2020_000375 [Hordeum vulgare]